MQGIAFVFHPVTVHVLPLTHCCKLKAACFGEFWTEGDVVFMLLPCCLLRLIVFRAVRKAWFHMFCSGCSFPLSNSKARTALEIFFFMLRRIVINCNCRSEGLGGGGSLMISDCATVLNLAWSSWKNRKIWSVGKRPIGALCVMRRITHGTIWTMESWVSKIRSCSIFRLDMWIPILVRTSVWLCLGMMSCWNGERSC